MRPSTKQWWIIASLAVLLALGGCKKRTEAPPAAAATPPPPAPTASLTANPTNIQRGQSATLTWRATNADNVTLEGVGAVDPSGSRAVAPTTSTTYRLLAKGPGGEASDSVRITVAEPAAAAPPSATDAELFARSVRDVFFDYDKYDIRPDAQRTLEAGARFLAQHPGIRFVVEGHCDERGSTEYNLALGDRRANAVREALLRMGVSGDRVRTISFGKEKPFCTQSDEDCWQQNRRGHFVYQK